MVAIVEALLAAIVTIELSQLPWMYVIDRRSRQNDHKLDVVLASKGVDPDDLPTYDFPDDD